MSEQQAFADTDLSSLRQAVVGGAYAYRLYKNGVTAGTTTDGDWYLRSSLLDPDEPDPDPEEPEPPLFQPGVPIYEAYANVMQSFQKLETLQQRVGNRSWQPGTGVVDVGGEEIEEGGLWGRIVADRQAIVSDLSTAGITHDVNNWRIEAGVDSSLSESESGKLVSGLHVFFGTTSASISSPHGDGNIASMGYGVGGTLTFYGSGGFYLDGQAQVNAFDSTLSSATADLDLVEGNNGFGYALSLEAGQKVVLTDEISITPQAQLAYSSVQFDDFTDVFGADVSLSDGDRLVGRVGLSLDFEHEWQDEAGESGRTHVYGIANVYYEALDGSDIDVSGTSFVNKADPFWGGVGIGGSVNWADDKYSIYGEVLANTSLGAIGESYSLSATGGMRVRW
jgi:fibronectin-binding autotransporter adhesin